MITPVNDNQRPVRVRLMLASTLYGAATLAAAIDSGCFGPADRCLLLVSNNAAVPETASPLDTMPGFPALRDRFDAVLSWNEAISPFHPGGWSPRPDDVPMWERHLRTLWRLGEAEVELVVESLQVEPALALVQLFPAAPIDLYADGLMSYGPTRNKLDLLITTRVRRLLHLDLVPGLTPLLLSEHAVPPHLIPTPAFTTVLSHLANPTEPHIGRTDSAGAGGAGVSGVRGAGGAGAGAGASGASADGAGADGAKPHGADGAGAGGAGADGAKPHGADGAGAGGAGVRGADSAGAGGADSDCASVRGTGGTGADDASPHGADSDGTERSAPALLLGQYLAALDILTPQEEEDLHLSMLRGVVERGHRRVVFKPHPTAPARWSRLLEQEGARLGADLTVHDSPELAEVLFQRLRPALVVGCFSTALLTASAFYGIPAAHTGTGLLLERLAPFQNSNRVPVTIVDAVLPPLDAPDRAPASAAELSALLTALGFCMQPQSYPHLRGPATAYLAAHLDDHTRRYFKRRRLTTLGLPGGLPVGAALTRNRAVRRLARRVRHVLRARARRRAEQRPGTPR